AYTETPASLANERSGSNAFLDSQDPSILDPLAAQGEMSLYDSLLYTHADYDNNVSKWEKYSNCYQAQDIYKYLFKHARESDGIWEQRAKRGYYYNYVASVVDLFVSYLFHSPIERK